MPTTVEAIKRKCLDLFEDNFATYLDTVEASWAATEAITLGDIQKFIYGDILSHEMPKLLPAMGVLSGRARETEPLGSYQGKWEVIVALRFILSDATPQTLAKKVDRYAEASMLLLQAYPSLDSLATRGLGGFQIMTTTLGGEEPNFIKCLQVQFTARYIGVSG